jgi:hypothetical protein
LKKLESERPNDNRFANLISSMAIGFAVKNGSDQESLNLYFYERGGLAFDWYDNYRSKALLTSYDDKEKGSDH